MKAGVADRIMAAAVGNYRHVARAFATDTLATHYRGAGDVERVVWHLTVPAASELVKADREGKLASCSSWPLSVDVRKRDSIMVENWYSISATQWTPQAAAAMAWLVQQVFEWRGGTRGWPDSTEMERHLEGLGLW